MTDPPYPQRHPEPPPRPSGQGQSPAYSSYETRRDVDAALAARQELGPEYGEHIAAGLAERVEQLAAYRTAELRHSSEREHQGGSLERTAQSQRFVTALVSLTAGIPVTAIAGHETGLIGIAICWGGIVGVNVAQALAARRHR
jgi:hypothetical protein